MQCESKRESILVLILVLVEHTLGDIESPDSIRKRSLNPCFSGTYSRSVPFLTFVVKEWGLNPCFSGTYSRRQ